MMKVLDDQFYFSQTIIIFVIINKVTIFEFNQKCKLKL